ncbi:MAG: hypothetical protein AUG51_22510 [Acidobacteria bacterium 13_1_20CM_3_53_8]|nr:MAG: hypothetical protein AUG51_22510 [Acidobacteria bacterium 13_1_20CM_3_53_8]
MTHRKNIDGLCLRTTKFYLTKKLSQAAYKKKSQFPRVISERLDNRHRTAKKGKSKKVKGKRKAETVFTD